MYKINKDIKTNQYIDYVIDYNGTNIYLFTSDWNGEKYCNSCVFDEDTFNYINTNKIFKPIDDTYEIFEEI